MWYAIVSFATTWKESIKITSRVFVVAELMLIKLNIHNQNSKGIKMDILKNQLFLAVLSCFWSISRKEVCPQLPRQQIKQKLQQTPPIVIDITSFRIHIQCPYPSKKPPHREAASGASFPYYLERGMGIGMWYIISPKLWYDRSRLL